MSQDFVLRETGAEISVDWRIERFISLVEEPNYMIYSPAFSISDAQWYLSIWVNGRMVDHSGWIYLTLWKRFSTSKKHTVRGTLGIRKTDDYVYMSFELEHEFQNWIGLVSLRLLPVSELRQAENVLTADGTLTVFATLKLSQPTVLCEDVFGIPQEVPFRTMHAEVSSEWKVEGFNSLPKEQGFSVKSPTFSIEGTKWCMVVYPNGFNSNCVGWLSLMLSRERSSSEKQTVTYTLGIRKTNGIPYRLVHYETEFVSNMAKGCRRLLKRSELFDSENGLVCQRYVTLFCTVRVNPSPLDTTTITESAPQASSDTSHEKRATTPSERDKHSQSTCVTLQESFRNFFLSERFCDVTIQVQGEKLPAHRSILVARSSVFCAMFEHDTEERRTGIVNIEDFDAATFRAFLLFLYSSDVNVVSADNAIPLYKAADKYNLLDLRDECIRYLQNRLNLGSFFEVVQLAFLHSEPAFLETATEFFLDNAKEIVATPEWQTMMIEHPALTNELFLKIVTKRP